MDPNPIRPTRGRARVRAPLPFNTRGPSPSTPTTVQNIHSTQPAQSIHSSQPIQPVHPSQPAQSIHSSQPTQPVHPSQPAQSIHSSQPAQPIHSSHPAQSIRSTRPLQSGPGLNMPRPPRQMPPRAPGGLQQRVQRPFMGPSYDGGGDSSSSSIRSPMLEVQQITEGIQHLSAAGENTALVPIGRGAVRGCRLIEMDHFRSPRPQSSLGPSGKEGSSGQPVHLKANYFPITSYTNWCLYQYRIDFNPEEDRIGTKRGLLSQHREQLGGYLFDGTMLFSGTKYSPENFELTSKRRSDGQIVILTVKFTNVIETGDYANIQVFNLLLRNCLRHLNLKLIGRNFYDPDAKVDLTQHKLQLWPGYETSIGKYEKDILLCAEISTKVMRQETVLDFLNQCTSDRNRNADWMNTFKSGVVGTTVMTTYNNETYRIDDIDENSNPSSQFTLKDGSKMTYTQYYKEKWNLTIRVGSQPMLISKNKKSARRFGGEDILVYLVPELCIMTGITDTMRNNFTLMKDMATYTRVNPGERVKRLLSFANRLLSTPESVSELKRWNLTLSNSLVDVPGRILPLEKIKSNTKVYDGGYEADWTKHLRALPMFTCAIMKTWVILTPQDFLRDVQSFATSLSKAAQGMSFILPPPIITSMKDGRSNTFLMHLETVINEKNPALILCVIPSPRGDIYSLIKRKLCIDRAVPSQVVLLKNVTKNNMSVCTKIAIQINCKIGGAPWLITIPKKGMMIIGFDVCHDSQNKNKSYGALVATMNDAHTSYFSCVEPHASGEELSNHLAAGISKALMKYKTKNAALPTSLVVYRDGVGEGQISHVHKTEVQLLKTACEQFYGPSSVPVAFIIVTKRISTRFFANFHQGAQNPQPGTVIDSVVTDPTKYDFYLVSQNVKQGTVTPTHYQVIEDTLKLPPDIIQKLTYKLTHMYYNWSGTVRVPAPCQLAHKLAFLTGQTLRGSPNTGLDELLYYL